MVRRLQGKKEVGRVAAWAGLLVAWLLVSVDNSSWIDAQQPLGTWTADPGQDDCRRIDSGWRQIDTVIRSTGAVEPEFVLASSQLDAPLVADGTGRQGAFAHEHDQVAPQVSLATYPYAFFDDGRVFCCCPCRLVIPVAKDLISDCRNFYTPRNLVKVSVTAGVCAVLANTTLDQEFFDRLQDHAVGDPDAWAVGRHLGDWWTVAPALASIWLGERLVRRHPYFDDHCQLPVGRWSEQSMRSLVVGFPAVIGLQYLTGASRPNESTAESRWKPFNDNNGVSGHAFVGAVPFLVAARMARRPAVKAAFFVGSGISGYSRIYDQRHYLSQVIFGWTVAYLAVEATGRTNQGRAPAKLVPLRIGTDMGLGLEVRR